MIEFEWPWLWAILPLPLLCYFLLPRAKNRPIAALRVANIDAFTQGSVSHTQNSRSKRILLSMLWALLVLSASRPLWVGDPVASPTQARELILAVDLSASMQEQDMRLNGRWVDRLTMVKAVLSQFIKQRQGDRIGLILFADNAYVQAPLTFDLTTVEQLLDESLLGLVGQRTAIGDAIGLAVKRFDRREKTNRVLVLLTDGENTAGNLTPEQALELAVARKVTIYTIGVGSNRNQRGLFNRGSGIDEQSLSAIATATNGKYFRATDTAELEKIYQQLDQLEKIDAEQQTLRPQMALFYWPLGLSLLLSFIGLIPSLQRGSKA
ncbi:MAG: VWA domain-containing protein [Gammaproteobacteria bacterium]|nr:VWA domain-containing protein [Gammaproteobacteria bacterium]